MDNDTTRQSVLFADLMDKVVVAKFDQPRASSDGGAILLKACCDEALGLRKAGIRAVDLFWDHIGALLDVGIGHSKCTCPAQISVPSRCEVHAIQYSPF